MDARRDSGVVRKEVLSVGTSFCSHEEVGAQGMRAAPAGWAGLMTEQKRANTIAVKPHPSGT